MRYGGCTKDGVRLIKSYVIDNVLTRLFVMISVNPRIFRQHSVPKKNKEILESYRIFQRGNAVGSKKKLV